MNRDQTNMAGGETDEDIRRLLALSGPRMVPPADVEARVRDSTMAAVRALPEPTVTEPRPRWMLAAAVVLMLIGGFVVTNLGDGTVAPAARISYATGGYTVRGSEPDTTDVAPGSIVRTSSRGRLLLELTDHVGLRMDQGSSLTVYSDSEVWLHSGRIYIDSNIDSNSKSNGRNAGSITVVTPYATIRDVGTQFEVSVAGEALEVATREGRVNVQLGETRLESGAEGGTGERLIIRSLELKERHPVSTTGEDWLWTQSSRPLFEVRDRSVADYLEWAARESGRMLVYESPIARQQAELVQLGGGGAVDADPESVRRVLSVTAFQPLTGPEYELRVGLGTR